ncbi:nucleotide exchange factor GrpE [Sanguibacter sp. A247]|uniref:nucleotide exchange factor GrpE n=1 Tax=unclassified Sanguibacter TaxID=2645534 RepID=UPI003FD77938
MTDSPFEFTDKRRVDPESGQPRESAAAPAGDGAAEPDVAVPDDASSLMGDAASGDAPLNDELAVAQALAAERLDDLQRERASFTNYRNRSLRDQEAARTRGIEDVLAALLPVLDDIDRARQAGELEGPFAAISDKLDAALGKFEVVRFGEVGEEFDPNQHDALMHEDSAEATTTTVKFVIEPGYRIGEKTVRAARVAVVGPQQ